MKANAMRYLVGFLLSCTLVFSGSAQPANDYFTNRTLLTGTDIFFSGTLFNASWESEANEVLPPFLLVHNQTVWWEWSPSYSSTVILDIRNPSRESIQLDGLSAYQLQDVGHGTFVAGLEIDTRLPHRFFKFNAEGGTNYQLQLAGADSANFDFHLIATNLYIIDQPQSQTITEGDSVMFGVIATGLNTFLYQWQRDGTNLSGENYPIFSLNHATTNETGTYTVQVTGTGGTLTSDPAVLVVTPTNPIPALQALPRSSSNVFSFRLLGEVGRRYRIQSSTNLTDWANDAGFQAPVFYTTAPFARPFRSVVFNETGTNTFNTPIHVRQKFYRAAAFHAVNEECNNNLKLFRFAQLLYAYENSRPANASVTLLDLLPYIKRVNGGLPECPEGGDYGVTVVIANPQCSLHPFEEP